MNINSFFKEIDNWDDFNRALLPLGNKEKGDAFEILTKLYFIIDHKYAHYENVWLLSEIPQIELEKIGLEKRDLGIDLIAKLGSEYHAIQCKYHTDKNHSITFREVSTFISLLGGYNRLTEGYICSSALGTSRNYDQVRKKPVSKILGDTWSKLDKEFFDRVRRYLSNESYSPTPFYPKPHQKKAVEAAYKHFIIEKESRGKLIFPCGTGKSLTGFWIMEILSSKSTLIAVPSLSLIKQTLDVYLKEIVARGIEIKWLCICSDESIGDNSEIKFRTDDLGIPCTTDGKYIKDWLSDNKSIPHIIFTTYQSSTIISQISQEIQHSFDLGILDEAHKTVGGKNKLFSHLLFEDNISIKLRVFMTATERFYHGSKNDIVSMDDPDVYGNTFCLMSFKEAIESKLLTDYKIVTIDIKKSEISDFIRENNLVQLNSNWKKETESRSLASMLALRKAMNKFQIKNAVSFHSSISKAIRSKELQDYISLNYSFAPIDTFTVSGKDNTSKRNDIIQEFAESEKALITNARCLTEGVDVPKIDCIVFADPKKSKVDIVQALGRALRKKEGKNWGYVILPVIYDENTHEIDNENFTEILSIIRGLAANDERIIEYFRDKSTQQSGVRKNENESLFIADTSFLNESDLFEELNIRIWENLSKFNWKPFNEAREFVRNLKLKNSAAWIVYCKSGKKPGDIPSSPKVIYKDFKTMGDFLGTENISVLFKEFRTVKESRDFIRSLNISTNVEWIEYLKTGKKPDDIPSTPWTYYSKDGKSYPSTYFFGNKRIAKQNRQFRSFEDAREFARSLGLKNATEWTKFVRSGEKPLDIPANPRDEYRMTGFKNWDDFLKC